MSGGPAIGWRDRPNYDRAEKSLQRIADALEALVAQKRTSCEVADAVIHGLASGE